MEPKSSESQQPSLRRPRLTIVAVALSVLIIVFFIQVPPASILGKADMVGYAICHRIGERSFIIDGRQLPLCARCTGTFLGAILGVVFVLLRRRQRASRMPPVPVLAILVLFTAFWAFDGVNSYLTLFPGAPHLYEPQNWLRLTTGFLNGLTLVSITLPIFNFTLWRDPAPVQVLGNIGEVLVMLPVVAVLVYVIQAEIGVLLYPLAILSSLGVVMMLVLINSMIAAVVLGLEGYAQTWRQALLPLSVGTALAILQMTTMISLRAYLTAKLGLSF